MTDVHYHQLIADVARDLVAQTVPQELPLFRAISEAYFKDPLKTLAGTGPKDEKLGFGMGEAVTFLTPIILAVGAEVVQYLAEQVVKTIKEEGAERATDAVRQLFKKFRAVEVEDTKQQPPLTPEQLKQVRRFVFEKACQLALSEAQSVLLADAVAGCLTTASA